MSARVGGYNHSMKQVTRDIDPQAARDLLERPARACLAFSGPAGPVVVPVILLWRENRYLLGLTPGSASPPAAGQEAVLLVDEGVYYFDLRAIYLRGQLQPIAAPDWVTPDGAVAGRDWFELLPIKTVAWDYGSMREVRDAD